METVMTETVSNAAVSGELGTALEMVSTPGIREELALIDLEYSVQQPFYRGDDGTWFERSTDGGFDAPVARRYVIETLGATGARKLSDDDFGDLFSPTMMARVRERCWLAGLPLEGLERFAADCIGVGLDPLPEIQSVLKELCKVSMGDPQEAHDRATIICRVLSDGRVTLREVAYGGV